MNTYIFYCINNKYRERVMCLESDYVAISIGKDYNADVWKLTEHEYICIYSPCEGRIAPSYLEQTSALKKNEE